VPRARLTGQIGPVQHLAIDGAGRTIAAAGEGMRVWDPDGTLLAALDAPISRPTSAAVAPDGAAALFACTDGTLWIWRSDSACRGSVDSG